MMRCADHTACMGGMRNAIVVRNLKGRYRHICEGDIEMDLKRVRVRGCGIY
jgi:hypothetical protein